MSQLSLAQRAATLARPLPLDSAFGFWSETPVDGLSLGDLRIWSLLWAGSALLAWLVTRMIGRDVVRANAPLRFWALACPMFFGLLIGARAVVASTARHSAPVSYYAPEIAAARAKAKQAGLTPSMTDEQMLRAIGEDPTTFQATRMWGTCGSITHYASATRDVRISRSASVGISMWRWNADGTVETWTLDHE